eukprot:m.72848 g.72848  ORF g.72848 m.72848 type:complete len:69 (-) comp8804_c0_seq1:674-880(-)
MGEGDAEGMGPVGVGSASSPFGRAMMDMVNHDTLKDIAETQERMFVSPSLPLVVLVVPASSSVSNFTR